VQTCRDREIVCWISHMGAAGAEDVMRRFEMGRSWAYARLNSLIKGGLLEQRTLLHRQPGLYIATTEGLRWCGLQQLGVHRVGPGAFEHTQKISEIASRLHAAVPGWEVLSERDIRYQETNTRQLIASARVGELPGGRPALHRPDLALTNERGSAVAVEVELSVKAPRRLAAICQGWARARHINTTYYLATPPAARAVERAVRETRAEGRIRVLALADLQVVASEVGEGVVDHA
jgi:hypothetical protein